MVFWIRIFIIVFVFGASLVNTQGAMAKQDEIYTSWRNNIAVDGVDVTSFFIGKPIKGKPQYAVKLKGAIWQFASQDNLDKFIKDPESFIPAYGGYCAWAVAHGKLARGKAKHWSIIDGRLYLNFNRKIKQRWLENTNQYIDAANALWPEILD